MFSIQHRGLLNGKPTGQTLTIAVCFAASNGFFLLGYDRKLPAHMLTSYLHQEEGVMSGILTEAIFLQQFSAMDPKNKSGAVQALVIAIYEIGCLIGAADIIAFGDKLGQRKAIIVIAHFLLAKLKNVTTLFLSYSHRVRSSTSCHNRAGARSTGTSKATPRSPHPSNISMAGTMCIVWSVY
jgi:MFS family permease